MLSLCVCVCVCVCAGEVKSDKEGQTVSNSRDSGKTDILDRSGGLHM